MQEQQNRCYSVAVIMTRCAYTHKFVFGLFWCTKKIPRKKLRGIFYCCFPEKQELGAPLGARRARVFQAVKKTLVGRALLARARLSVK